MGSGDNIAEIGKNRFLAQNFLSHSTTHQNTIAVIDNKFEDGKHACIELRQRLSHD